MKHFYLKLFNDTVGAIPEYLINKHSIFTVLDLNDN